MRKAKSSKKNGWHVPKHTKWGNHNGARRIVRGWCSGNHFSTALDDDLCLRDRGDLGRQHVTRVFTYE